jgi:hypothetical protein
LAADGFLLIAPLVLETAILSADDEIPVNRGIDPTLS